MNETHESLEQLLSLFRLELPLKEEDLKIAKKKVLLLHPDKNLGVKNINDIFIKYKNSYKKLELLYLYTNPKKGRKDINHELDPTFKKYIEKNGYDNKEFIKHFNKMFENVYIKSDDEKKGYDKWLKSEENIYFVDDIEKTRNVILNNNELAKVSTEPEYYSKSEIYSDLKHAHANSVIPIDCDKVMRDKPVFKNMNEFINYRQKTTPEILNEEKSKMYLQKEYKKQTEDSIQMAYQYKVQEEEIEKRRVKYYSKFLILE